MGNNNSTKCELTEYSDVCEMAKCLTDNIIGLSSNSSSPTDTWIVEFIDGTTYEDKPIKKAFVKLWISPDVFKYTDDKIIKLNDYDTMKSDLVPKFSGLDYEARVYRDIVKPLIEKNICPNFIKFLGYGKNCSFENVSRMASGPSNEPRKTQTLYGNTIRILQDERRKSITQLYDKIELKKFTEVISHLDTVKYITYNMLANEVIEPGTVQLEKFFNDTKIDITTKSIVLFQGLAACYAMSCSKMVHNDLHTGNLYVEPLEKTTRMNYIYEGDLYSFETKYIVKVFDFDRAYVKRFGENPFLKSADWACDDYSQCNKYIENIDALKLISGVYKQLKQKDADKLVDICTMNETADVEKSTRILTEVFEEGIFLNHNNVPLAIDKYQLFNSTIDIMKNLSRSSFSNSSIQSTYPVGYIPDPEYTFICNKDMFNDKGKLSDIKVTKGISDKTTIDELTKKVERLEMEIKVLIEALTFQSLNKPSKVTQQQTQSQSEESSEFHTQSTNKPPVKKERVKARTPCKPGEVRDLVTKKCRQKKKPGRKKKLDKSPETLEKLDKRFPDFGDAYV